jgi:hypothetical protein
MSHTTVNLNAYYPGRFQIDVSIDGTTWTSVSGTVTQVSGAEQERLTGEAYTGGSAEHAVVTVGKIQPTEIEVRFLHTEQTGELATILWTEFHSSTPALAVRWRPVGAVANGPVYATSLDGTAVAPAPLIKLALPELSPDDGGPALGAFTVRTPRIARYTGPNDTNLNPAP